MVKERKVEHQKLNDTHNMLKVPYNFDAYDITLPDVAIIHTDELGRVSDWDEDWYFDLSVRDGHRPSSRLWDVLS